MTRINSFQNHATTAGRISVVLTCFCIPVSTSLMGVFALLSFLFWLISGKIKQLPEIIQRYPAALFSILLFLLFIVGLSYSPAPLKDATDTLFKYRELLFIPVVISLLHGNSRYPRMAENSFIAGCIILMLISYGIYFSILPAHKYGNSILYHITHSFFMAMLGFWSLQRMFDSKRAIFFWLVIFIAVTINLFHINPGRTGMLLYLLLLLLGLAQRLSIKHLIVAMVGFATILSGAFLLSDNLSSRTRLALTEIQNYQPEKSRTSLGMRFDWWYKSVELMQESPIYGHGTGSFGVMLEKLNEKKKIMPSDNPHNEYLFIGVQLGGVGLALYLLIFGSQLVAANKLTRREKYILQGIVLAMASGCLINSFLYDSHQGHFYAFLSAVLLASSSSSFSARVKSTS